MIDVLRLLKSQACFGSKVLPADVLIVIMLREQITLMLIKLTGMKEKRILKGCSWHFFPPMIKFLVRK